MKEEKRCTQILKAATHCNVLPLTFEYLSGGASDRDVAAAICIRPTRGGQSESADEAAGGPDLHLYFVQCCFDTPLFPCSCFMCALVNNATHTHALNKCRLYEGGVRAAEPNM